MAPTVQFREDEGAIDSYLERAAGALHELYRRVGVLTLDFGRQTGGPRVVVSDYAVLNGDLHHRSPFRRSPS